jgi:aminopeptidase N
MPCRATLLVSLVLLQAALPWTGAAEISAQATPRTSALPTVEILRHDLAVEIWPEAHRIQARDRMTLRALTSDTQPVAFTLNPALRLGEVTAIEDGRRRSLNVTRRPKDARGGDGQAQQVAVSLGALPPGHVVTLEWSYEGTINDPPRESRQLRFVTPSETAGHIGPEGVYLSGETMWYPDLPAALPAFAVEVRLPAGWEAVTHGTRLARSGGKDGSVSQWQVGEPTEALTLVANRFVQTRRDWRDAGGRSIEVSTYLFAEDAGLAPEYLDAAVAYLDVYAKLLGPYPFAKFAVVENFFPSGLGMPSFTLLGSGVIKRHYVQPYALGHEIVHSWIGNWVLNNPERGNWVEGLTTYLANYYYEERTGPPDRAREQRRLMLLGYAVYVWPEEDYPVASFRQKTDQKDNAIGYQKSAMIFHLLRREVGEEAFWAGLRRLVADFGGRRAEWDDLERVFSQTSGRDLGWFFTQWVTKPGAPELTMSRAAVSSEDRPGHSSPYRLTVTIAQHGEPYRLKLPLRVFLAGGQVHDAWVEIKASSEAVAVPLPARPLSLRLDPDFETFRRLPRNRVPPMLNLFVTDRPRTLVAPHDAEPGPYRDVARQVAARDPAIVQIGSGEAIPKQGSVLFLGGPLSGDKVDAMREACGPSVSMEGSRVKLDDKVFDEPGMAVLLSCRRPGQPGSVISVFHGMTPAAAAPVARLLFFYGWHSYVVFREGVVLSRGDLAGEPEEVLIEGS